MHFHKWISCEIRWYDPVLEPSTVWEWKKIGPQIRGLWLMEHQKLVGSTPMMLHEEV
jgi:hypothetical protein